MKDITKFINEAIVNEAKIKPVKTTVGEYVAWFFGFDNFYEIDPVDDFENTEFDPISLKENFKNKLSAQFEFLYDHEETEIVLKREETSGSDDVKAEFTVGGVTFYPIHTGVYEG